MSEPSSKTEALPLELARDVEHRCNRFEVAWQGGTPPRLEDYVAETPEAIRAALLRELILLDIHYRQARGESCQAANYQQRFPSLAPAWLAGALAPSQEGQPEQSSSWGQTRGQTESEEHFGRPGQPSTLWEGTLGGRTSPMIGPYKLLQKLGEGGMGTVYMAEQEHPIKRRVALKIIKAGMDSARVIARFEQERQALALMDHPNIAKVLDAGTTQDGRPYFVMERVKGIPITKFCVQERLTPKERLELIIPICHAVQHAHQKGIIHRDLKPSNVIIAFYDGKPVPKVIDFGVVKA